MKNKAPSKYRDIQDKFIKETNSFFDNEEVKNITEHIANGNNVYVRANRRETSSFDGEWIDKIDECIPELEDIVRNPRKVMETVGNVVPIELVKKVNSESVRHLATHTQNVKDITEDNNVIPGKILNIENEDYYATYENRFIATLIRKLLLFVEKRYEFLREHALLKDIEELKVKSKVVIDGSLVEIETKVKVLKPADFEGIDEVNAYVERIMEMRKHLSYCYNSQFMKMLKTEKNVRNPILMTNILRKNPTYNKCYKLYKYLEGYRGVGVNYSVNDEYLKFDDEELIEINRMLAVNFLAVNPNNPSRFATAKPIVCKPKILASMDDEEFVYGPYLEGPVEFVRIDEDYRKETESLYEFYRVEDVYDKPENYVPKKERVIAWLKKEDENYVRDERLQNRTMNLMHDAKDSLMSRKRRAGIAFEKKALEIIEKREQEQRELEEKMRLEEERRAKDLRDKAREKLINTAKNDAVEMRNKKPGNN